MAEIGLRIIPYNAKMREARKVLGYTQADVARMIGVGQATVSSVERWGLASREVMEDIACVLSLSIDDLLPPDLTRAQRDKLKTFDVVVDADRLALMDEADAVTYLPDSTQEDLKAAFDKILPRLPARQRRIIGLRFGLDDGRERSQFEIAKLYGVTVERIRQVEAQALRRLRHPLQSRLLRAYAEGTPYHEDQAEA